MFTFAIYFFICAKFIAASEDYVLNFDSSIYVCADEDSQSFVDTSGMEIKRPNETTAILTGDIIFMKEIGEKTMVEFVVEKEVGDRFDIVLTKEICDLCEEMKDSESFYYHYLGIFGFPDECPIEPILLLDPENKHMTDSTDTKVIRTYQDHIYNALTGEDKVSIQRRCSSVLSSRGVMHSYYPLRDTYHVKDFIANAKDLPINKQNEGRYQVTLNVFKDSSGECQFDRIFIACFKLDVIIEEVDG